MEKNFYTAKKYTLWLLNKKDYTEKEIFIKLRKKGYSDEIIQKIIEFLKNYGLLNNNKIAEKTIEIYIKKLKSQKYIEEKLKLKGINSEEIKEKLKDINEFEIASKIAEKKLKTMKETDINRKKQKIFNYLTTRGFNYDIIEKIINKIFKNEGE